MVTMSIQSAPNLGSALRARRRELHISQEDLAGVVGVNRRVVGEIERGKGTAQVQIVLELLQAVGLDIRLHPREEG